jgi:hypothetical protein
MGDHGVGKGLGKPEIAGFALSCKKRWLSLNDRESVLPHEEVRSEAESLPTRSRTFLSPVYPDALPVLDHCTSLTFPSLKVTLSLRSGYT